MTGLALSGAWFPCTAIPHMCPQWRQQRRYRSHARSLSHNRYRRISGRAGPTIPIAASHIPTWRRNGHSPSPDRSRNPVRGKEIPRTGIEAAESETDGDLPHQGNSRCMGSEKFFIRMWMMAMMAAIAGMLTSKTRSKMLRKDRWGRELKSEVIIHNEDAPDSTGTFTHR